MPLGDDLAQPHLFKKNIWRRFVSGRGGVDPGREPGVRAVCRDGEGVAVADGARVAALGSTCVWRKTAGMAEFREP